MTISNGKEEEEFKNLGNKELIEEFEIIKEIYFRILTEFYSRYQNDKLTEDELEKIINIGKEMIKYPLADELGIYL